MNRPRWSEADTFTTMLGHRFRLRYFVRGIAFVWTVLVIVLLLGQLSRETNEIAEIAELQVKSLIQRDLVYRQWVALNSGVYVRITPQTPPNPLLSSLHDRDLTCADGRKLTLVNPAYMSRLVYDLAARRDGSRSHITSLKPFRKENTPEPWEAAALKGFEQGETEYRTVVRIGDHDYFRYMTPLSTDTECLDCHARQGYRTGDVRGGISVTLPLDPLQKISRKEKRQSCIGFGLLWLLGMVGIITSSSSVHKSLRDHEAAEKRLRYLSTHDGLTDCYNRIYFDTELARFVKGREFPIGVVMVDLDRLKQVNDGMGHAAGDDLIQRAGRVLKQACREADIIARIGGDEFALLLPGADAAGLEKVLARIRRCVAEANSPEGAEELSLSLGAVSAENAEALRHALTEADLRMYQDKLARKKKSRLERS